MTEDERRVIEGVVRRLRGMAGSGNEIHQVAVVPLQGLLAGTIKIQYRGGNGRWYDMRDGRRFTDEEAAWRWVNGNSDAYRLVPIF